MVHLYRGMWLMSQPQCKEAYYTWEGNVFCDISRVRKQRQQVTNKKYRSIVYMKNAAQQQQTNNSTAGAAAVAAAAAAGRVWKQPR